MSAKNREFHVDPEGNTAVVEDEKHKKENPGVFIGYDNEEPVFNKNGLIVDSEGCPVREFEVGVEGTTRVVKKKKRK